MVHAFISVFLCLLCWHTQDPNPATEVDLRVKGVGLGSSYARVVSRLGRPISSKREKILDETCGPAHTLLRLRYKGAVVELMGDLQGRNFEVVTIEVTSAQMLVTPGVKVGLTEQTTRSKLGAPWQTRNESDYLILNYVTKGNDGGAALYFRDGRLVKIQWQYTLC